MNKKKSVKIFAGNKSVIIFGYIRCCICIISFRLKLYCSSPVTLPCTAQAYHLCGAVFLAWLKCAARVMKFTSLRRTRSQPEQRAAGLPLPRYFLLFLAYASFGILLPVFACLIFAKRVLVYCVHILYNTVKEGECTHNNTPWLLFGNCA